MKVENLFSCHQINEERKVPLATLSFLGHVMYVGYEGRTNWVGLSRHHVLVSGLNHCVPLLSLFISI